MANRPVQSAAEYQQLERDFMQANAAHEDRVMHKPPSIPLTLDNWPAKANDLQNVARVRELKMNPCR
jgi:hypothetical protein